MHELEVLRILLDFATLKKPKVEEFDDAILWARAMIRRHERRGLRRVVIESPFSGDVSSNKIYALRCLRDSIGRGEAPLVSHLLYPQVSVKYNISERTRGMAAGWAWTAVAHACVVYKDLGVTSGMLKGIELAQRAEIPVEERWLENHPN